MQLRIANHIGVSMTKSHSFEQQGCLREFKQSAMFTREKFASSRAAPQLHRALRARFLLSSRHLSTTTIPPPSCLTFKRFAQQPWRYVGLILAAWVWPCDSHVPQVNSHSCSTAPLVCADQINYKVAPHCRHILLKRPLTDFAVC